MLDITKLFCSVDDFWKSFESHWCKIQISHKSSRGPTCNLSMSEIMTILIFFHQSNFRTFKYFYFLILENDKKALPKLPSYSRFVYIQKQAFIPLFAFLHQCKGKVTTGWFFGFKLHLIVNENGEIFSFQITQGNVSDISPVKSLAEGLWGKLIGDRGYISSSLFQELLEKNIQLITKIRNNMKNKLMDIQDKLLLRKRAIIETINDQLKNISRIEHSRHRSPANFLINLLSGLIAYCHQKKPKFKNSSKIFNSLLKPKTQVNLLLSFKTWN